MRSIIESLVLRDEAQPRIKSRSAFHWKMVEKRSISLKMYLQHIGVDDWSMAVAVASTHFSSRSALLCRLQNARGSPNWVSWTTIKTVPNTATKVNFHLKSNQCHKTKNQWLVCLRPNHTDRSVRHVHVFALRFSYYLWVLNENRHFWRILGKEDLV